LPSAAAWTDRPIRGAAISFDRPPAAAIQAEEGIDASQDFFASIS